MTNTDMERLELEGQMNLFCDYLREKIAQKETQKREALKDKGKAEREGGKC